MFFKDFAVSRNSLQLFENWASSYLAEHLLMTASVCIHSLVNVRTAVFETNKTLAYISKKLIHRIGEKKLKVWKC